MKHKRLIVSVAVTALEFVIFLVWGLNMNGGDEMGFGLITSYFLFPLTTLILSAYLAHENIIYVIPFTLIMFAAQNFMPFFVFGSFEVVLILCFTLIPSFVGSIIGMIIKQHKNS
ncbi:MAG: hypothetical protein IJE19_08620 [Clostridia bacterium]|nr:hypothetical protein [Clostridia bacterium]